MSDMEFAIGTVLKRDLVGVPGKVFSHMGIYVGEGEVVHFDGEWGSGSSARIARSGIDGFSKGRAVRVHAAPTCEAHGAAVVGEALKVFENPGAWDGSYSLPFRNCEDFTGHCFSVEYSMPGSIAQVGKAPLGQRLKAIVGTVAATVGAVLMVFVSQKTKNSQKARRL